MALLSKIDITINNKPLRNFQKVILDQNLYGYDRFEIICRYDALEDLDGFLIEKTKDFLGFPVVIQTKFVQGDSDSDGVSFLGYVTEIESSRSAMADDDMVIISGGSKEVVLNRKPHNRAFLDKTLDEIVKEVLKDYELRPKVNARNKQRYPYIVQFEESDFEFLRRLSVRFGEWFFFNGSEIIFGAIPEDEKSLTIGQDLDNFRYGLRVAPVNFRLFCQESIYNNDAVRYKSGQKKDFESNLNVYGKHAHDMSKKIYSLHGLNYYEHINVNEGDIGNEMDAVCHLQESAGAVNLAGISGNSVNGTLSAGNFVKIDCFKKDGNGRMNYGRYLLTSVRHFFDNTLSYRNSFTAIPGETAIPENTDPGAVRRTSNQIGQVADNRDPEKLGRIRISFMWMEPWENSGYMTPWVRIVTPYAHKNSGIYFVPPKNAPVLVGFEDGDVEKPYCLGALYGADGCPDTEWTGNYCESDAKIHAIRTQSGQTIEFHDEQGAEKIIVYDTAGNNELELDSANKKIKISTKGNMSINVGGALEISAGNIKMVANDEIRMQSGSSIINISNGEVMTGSDQTKLTGTKLELLGNTIRMDSDASTEVRSMAKTYIKGSIVMIN